MAPEPSLAYPETDDMDIFNRRITITVKRLVEWLVNGDLTAIEQYTGGVRLSADLLRDAITEYGHKLVMPPEKALENIDVIEVTGAIPRKWSVRFDLWTEDEGRSDLTLECTLIDSENDFLDAEVDNIHVL